MFRASRAGLLSRGYRLWHIARYRFAAHRARCSIASRHQPARALFRVAALAPHARFLALRAYGRRSFAR